MHGHLLKSLSQLGSPTLLVVGDFMLDAYIYGDATRISPEAPVPILKIKHTEQSCGGAASVAMDIAALGAIPICLGIIGTDENGPLLKQRLAGAGCITDALVSTDERPTITKTRLIGLAQHRHQQQLFRMDQEITDPLSSSLQEAIIASYRKYLSEVDVVCLQDYNKGLLIPEVCQELIKLARTADKTVLVDPACDIDYRKYRSANVITPNRQETALAVHYPLENQQDYQRAARQLAESLALEAVVITLDKDGAYLRTADHDGLIPTRERRVYDVTGAGDMVLAMLGTALASGFDYPTAVQLSNIAGGIEVEKFGVATVTVDEIINEIIGQSRHSGGKVVTWEALKTQLDWHRQHQDTIVFTNGCFDILHPGHISYLQFCKTQGQVVVVGLNSDASVQTIKGPTRPLNPEDDRAIVLAALECVDYVTLFTEPDPHRLIQHVRPDVLIKGQDWQDKGIIGADVVESYGGRIAYAPLVEGRSTTAILNKMNHQRPDS